MSGWRRVLHPPLSDSLAITGGEAPSRPSRKKKSAPRLPPSFDRRVKSLRKSWQADSGPRRLRRASPSCPSWTSHVRRTCMGQPERLLTLSQAHSTSWCTPMQNQPRPLNGPLAARMFLSRMYSPMHAGRRATPGWSRGRSQCGCAASQRVCTRWIPAWLTKETRRRACNGLRSRIGGGRERQSKRRAGSWLDLSLSISDGATDATTTHRRRACVRARLARRRPSDRFFATAEPSGSRSMGRRSYRDPFPHLFSGRALYQLSLGERSF